MASGSDDFRIYLWKIPEGMLPLCASNSPTRLVAVLSHSKYRLWLYADLDAVKNSSIDGGVVPSPHLVLPGHRSIANQIRYSPTHHLLCSSGVEKIIKARDSANVLMAI